MFYVYVLISKKNRDLYIGYCEYLKNRFSEHNKGLVKATKGYKPWKLVYYEAYLAKTDATRREVQIKKNHRAKQDLKNQITNSLKDN